MNAITSFRAILRGGARSAIPSLALASALIASLVTHAGAQIVGFTADAANTQYGTYADANDGHLNIGRNLAVAGAGIEVFQLGVFDYQSDGLLAAHTVTLFSNQIAVASVTIPAGTVAPLINAFRFEPLTTPLFLPAGNYAIVAYQMNGANSGNDPYGNGNAAGFNGGGNASAGSGIYDFVTSGSPAYPTQTSGEDFASVSFTYTNVAASVGVWAGGGADNNWSTAGNWNGLPTYPTNLVFAGTVRLKNTNDNTGITVDNLTFDAAAGAFVLAGNDLTLAGNIGFNGDPATTVTQTINLNTAWSCSESIDTPTNGNLVLGGDITSSTDTSLIKTGAGALTLGGTNAIASWDLDGGTTTIAGSTTISGDGNSRIYVGNGDAFANCSGTLIIQNGATLSINGGFADSFVIGRDSGTGRVVQNGGTFAFNPGGSTFLFVGATSEAGTRAEYDMNGGLLDLGGNNFGVGLANGVLSTGLVNQVSGVITNVGSLQLGALVGIGQGVYTLSGGSIYIGSGGVTSFSGNYLINLGGGTVGASTSWSSPLNVNLTNLNGSVTFEPAGNTITLSGGLSGTGGLTVTGPGTVELSGANTYTGDTVVSTGSTLQLDASGSSLGACRLANGALLNLNNSGTFAAAHVYTNGGALAVGTYNAGNLSGFITGSGSLQVASSISTGLWTANGVNNNWSTANNWDQNAVPVFPIGLTFAGSTRLANNNDLNGITASSITFDAAAGAFVIGGNDLTLSGNIGFNGNPAAPVTQTIDLNLAWSASENINTPTNGNLVLDGDITSSTDTSLIKVGAGALTLGGTNSIASWDLDGGTNIITGNTTINGDGNSRIYVGNGDAFANCSSTLILQNGSTLTINGNFADSFVIGRDSGSGTVIQNGGTFAFNPSSALYLFVGATSEAGTRSEYDLNAGVLDLGGNNFGVALGDRGIVNTGIVNQVGGSIINVGSLQLGALLASGHGVYTISGGSIYIGSGGITTVSGNYAVNLGGGIVGATAAWSTPLNITLTGSNGPVTFDTAGNTITLAGALSGSGGLNVIGSGTLELAGANSYSGDTTVTAGTWQLDAAGTGAGAFHVANGSLLNLNFTGTYIVGRLYTNNVAVGNGIYNASNLPGFITGSGSIQVAGVVFSTQPQNGVVYLNGNYGQSATLTSAVVGGAATYQWYQNGNPIVGATSSNLALSNLQITNGGNFYVVATSSSGSVTSSVASLTIYGLNNNLFAHDGFAYPGSTDGSTLIDGTSQNGGLGWNGPWQLQNGDAVNVDLGNLIGGSHVPAGFDSRSVSNSMEDYGTSRVGRFFDTSTNSVLFTQGFVDANGNIGANGKTIYLSFLQQSSVTSGFYELEVKRGDLGDGGRVGGVGDDAGDNDVHWRSEYPAGGSSTFYDLGAGDTGVDFYVVRFDFTNGTDKITVYRNPTSTTEPAVPTVTAVNADMSFDAVSVAAYNGPDLKIDEVRLGATWADAMGLAVSNLLPPTRTAHGYLVQFASTPGYSYRIQRATSLTGPWTGIATVVGPTNAFIQFEDANAPSGQAFYRTVTP